MTNLKQLMLESTQNMWFAMTRNDGKKIYKKNSKWPVSPSIIKTWDIIRMWTVLEKKQKKEKQSQLSHCIMITHTIHTRTKENCWSSLQPHRQTAPPTWMAGTLLLLLLMLLLLFQLLVERMQPGSDLMEWWTEGKEKEEEGVEEQEEEGEAEFPLCCCDND